MSGLILDCGFEDVSSLDMISVSINLLISRTCHVLHV